jgi:MFS family permease
MVLVNFFDAAVVSQVVLVATDLGGATQGQAAMVFAAGNAGVVLIGILAGRIAAVVPFALRTLGAEMMCGLFVIGLGLAHSVWQVAVCWAGYSALGVLFNIGTSSLRQRTVPAELLGRVMTTSAVVAWSAVPLGAVLGGRLVAGLGARPVLVTVGIVTALLALLFVASPLGRPHLAAEASRPAAAETG